MILADKIILLRKENSWSQEQLAEMIGVSRQAVSKWESAQAIPDMDKLLKLSEVFGVSIDFLVKDQKEDVEFTEITGEKEPGQKRTVSVEEANRYMELVEKKASIIATGVLLCILSPVPLLLLGGAAEYGIAKITENAAGGFGVAILLCMVAVAVLLFIQNGMALEKYDYLEKEELILAYGIEGIVRKKKEDGDARYHREIATGVVLCIASTVPLMVLVGLGSDGFALVCAVGLLLFLVSLGVFRLICAGMVRGSYDRLLQEGDYAPEKKKDSKKMEPFSQIYWCLVTAVYLGWSFYTWGWDRTWIVWPVAGVAFGALYGIGLLLGRRKK